MRFYCKVFKYSVYLHHRPMRKMKRQNIFQLIICYYDKAADGKGEGDGDEDRDGDGAGANKLICLSIVKCR